MGRWVAGLLVVGLLAFVGSGCGGRSKEELAAERATYTGTLASAVYRRELVAVKRAAAVREQKCRKRLDGFVTALRDLDSRTTIGISFTEHGDALSEIRIQYDRIGGGSGLGGLCRAAALSAESAMNDYVEAHTYWNDCLNAEGSWAGLVDEYGYTLCEFEGAIKTLVQLDWRTASKKTLTARRKLDAVSTKFDKPTRHTVEIPENGYSVDGTLYGATLKQFCRLNVPLPASKPCTDLRDLLTDGVSDGELGDLNNDLKGIVEANGFQPTSVPATSSPA